MKDILTAPFVEEMKKTTANMYRLGWDERNGGNISYIVQFPQALMLPSLSVKSLLLQVRVNTLKMLNLTPKPI